MKKILFLFLVFFIMCAGTIGYFYYQNLAQWKYLGESKEFYVQPGEGFASVNGRLYRAGLIDNMRFFYYLAKWKHKMNSLHHGRFLIISGSTTQEILETLLGPPLAIKVTIPEGKNIYDIAKILADAGLGKEKDFIQQAFDKSLIKMTFNPHAQTVEGYLYPETYSFESDTPVKNILMTMILQFQRSTSEVDFSHPFLTNDEVVTLASIVEKETGSQTERPIIAGVFTNRLLKKMKLQSDPTTIYGMWQHFDGNIRKKDLTTFSPYNTYTVPALPIGPIANPSVEAINAVLHPAKHDYLFFVSKNDGTHIFTKTYAEHNAAVDVYQRTKSNREGKSWRMLKK